MEKELHLRPETRVEQTDMEGITDPRRQKERASNQGVRFYVDRENKLLEEALMRTLSGRLEEVGRALDDLTNDLSFALREIVDLQSRMLFLECRWYERIMRYLEWDILSFRIWLFERWNIGSNPIPEEENLNSLNPSLVDEGPTV